MMQRKPTTAFVYVLGAYVLVQFVWWGYHLIDLTRASAKDPDAVSGRVLMIVGEGSVFLLLLLFGLWRIKSSIRKEINIARQQNNFMLSVTHELKTPLAATKLYLQTLLKHQQLPEEKKQEVLNKAIEESNRLEGLVEQILTASRLEQQSIDLNRTKFELNEAVSELIQIQQNRQNIQIAFQAAQEIHVHTDRFLSQTAINNLLENALKFTDPAKGVSVKISVHELYISIRIKDFGKGISVEDQRLLFRKFSRLGNEETRTTKGTGLGLYIAYQSSKAIGGMVKLINPGEAGAEFEIQIPNE
ncbi:MAG: sensor histidine kinase [Fluviicola sp.]|jgi:signal transduction histidine kinase